MKKLTSWRREELTEHDELTRSSEPWQGSRTVTGSTVRRPSHSLELNSTRPRRHTMGPFTGRGHDDGPWWCP
uniref:Uncharacterized protein n=1 Tax=Solanum tuberosum TaxID=4113 RepID=M1DM22_SOLTU